MVPGFSLAKRGLLGATDRVVQRVAGVGNIRLTGGLGVFDNSNPVAPDVRQDLVTWGVAGTALRLGAPEASAQPAGQRSISRVLLMDNGTDIVCLGGGLALSARRRTKGRLWRRWGIGIEWQGGFLLGIETQPDPSPFDELNE